MLWKNLRSLGGTSNLRSLGGTSNGRSLGGTSNGLSILIENQIKPKMKKVFFNGN